MSGESRSRTRAFSLRAPIANEEERELLQRRLGLTWLVVFLLAASFWVVTLAVLLVRSPEHVQHMWTERTSQLQLATTGTSLVFWLATRRGPRSALTLDVLDAASTLLLCTGWAVMTLAQAPRPHVELVGLLACSYTLVMRAALIPSTPARTATLGLLAQIPIILVSHYRYVRDGIVSDWPIHPGGYVATWAMLGVAATTTTTAVIYGLQLRVRQAMQLGQYSLEEKIGEGGMGAVYRASHAMLRRPTAIKLISGTTNQQAIARFEREVQITARLTHPNTVAIFDYGRTPDGVFYYAMEYLDGISLDDLVRAHGPQPPARVVHVLLQICGALDEAHAEGLVHRDIKPANVMLTSRGKIHDFVKVLDFGLVKESTAPVDVAVTNANTILGTPHYMAPESILAPDSVDGAADIYALGATAFFMLTGKRVFDGTNLVEICAKHVHEKPVAPSSVHPGVPEALDRIVLACLAKKPEDRPASAAALAEMLRDANVGVWTNADAAAWWAKHDKKKASPPSSSTLGATITVTLDDRARRAG